MCRRLSPMCVRACVCGLRICLDVRSTNSRYRLAVGWFNFCPSLLTWRPSWLPTSVSFIGWFFVWLIVKAAKYSFFRASPHTSQCRDGKFISSRRGYSRAKQCIRSPVKSGMQMLCNVYILYTQTVCKVRLSVATFDERANAHFSKSAVPEQQTCVAKYTTSDEKKEAKQRETTNKRTRYWRKATKRALIRECTQFTFFFCFFTFFKTEVEERTSVHQFICSLYACNGIRRWRYTSIDDETIMSAHREQYKRNFIAINKIAGYLTINFWCWRGHIVSVEPAAAHQYLYAMFSIYYWSFFRSVHILLFIVCAGYSGDRCVFLFHMLLPLLTHSSGDGNLTSNCCNL